MPGLITTAEVEREEVTAYWESNSSSSSLTHLSYLFDPICLPPSFIHFCSPQHIRISLCLLLCLPLSPPCPASEFTTKAYLLAVPPPLFSACSSLPVSFFLLASLSLSHSLLCSISVSNPILLYLAQTYTLPILSHSLHCVFQKFELAESYEGTA